MVEGSALSLDPIIAPFCCPECLQIQAVAIAKLVYRGDQLAQIARDELLWPSPAGSLFRRQRLIENVPVGVSAGIVTGIRWTKNLTSVRPSKRLHLDNITGLHLQTVDWTFARARPVLLPSVAA
jgi:hypothetical protein